MDGAALTEIRGLGRWSAFSNSGAKEAHGLQIDYVGIWNERTAPAKYVTTLRRALDEAGFGTTLIVAKDNNVSVCHEMLADPKLNDAVSVIGLHYPSDYIDPELEEHYLRLLHNSLQSIYSFVASQENPADQKMHQ